MWCAADENEILKDHRLKDRGAHSQLVRRADRRTLISMLQGAAAYTLWQ